MATMMDPGYVPNPKGFGKSYPTGGPTGISTPPPIASRQPRRLPAQGLNPPPQMPAQPIVPPQGVGWGGPQAGISPGIAPPQPGILPPAPQFPIMGSPVLGAGFMNMLRQRLLAAKGLGQVQDQYPIGAQAPVASISGAMQPGIPSVGFRPMGGLIGGGGGYRSPFSRSTNDVSGYY